jgi:hypothetical protein
MVAPRTGAEEITLAENQTAYKPLVAAVYSHPDFNGAPYLLTRWRFTDAERTAIAAGEDLYLAVLTFGQPLQPLAPQVGPGGYLVSSDAGAPA